MLRRIVPILLAMLPAGPALAAGGESGLSSFIFQVINLLILIGVIVYFGRKPIQSFFADRRDGIRDDLKEAERLHTEATERHTKWQQRLTDLDAELESIRQNARERAEAERSRILADAAASADRIRADARTAVDQELRRARDQLREEAADLAIELAGEALRGQVTDADRDRLLDEFIETVAQTGSETPR